MVGVFNLQRANTLILQFARVISVARTDKNKTMDGQGKYSTKPRLAAIGIAIGIGIGIGKHAQCHEQDPER